MGAIAIVDAFYGDAGKGKFCAYLAKSLSPCLAVRAGTGTNAGHSYHIGDKLIKCRMLPLGWINTNTRVLVGSGVAVSPEIFLEEVKTYHLEGRAFVDWRCPVIEKSHINLELSDHTLKYIDSTKSGTGAARADFIMRRGKQVKDIPELSDYLIDGIYEANRSAVNDTIIIEGSQATYLSLYASDRYPFVTSDNCTTAAFIDDVGLNWQLLKRVILLVKCLPTCVGNGYLPFEMSKQQIIQKGLEEYGVNTGRFKRRSSKIDWDRLRYSVMINGPTEIALTFCDQYDAEVKRARKKSQITAPIVELIEKIEKISEVPVTYLSTGEQIDDIIEL